MKMVDASFKINTSTSTQGSSSNTCYRFEILIQFDHLSSLSQCQENLAAYKLGKTMHRDEQLFPKKVNTNKVYYYNTLMSK